jgi:hypothetical protein
VVLSASGQAFDANIIVKRTLETRRDPQSDDPTQTVSIPTLGGSLHFPAVQEILDHHPEDIPGFHELLDPLGMFATVTFDLGDYNPATQQLVLPYDVPGYAGGSFGELTGTLSGGKFTGDWFSKPFGDAGTFVLTVEPGTAQQGGQS